MTCRRDAAIAQEARLLAPQESSHSKIMRYAADRSSGFMDWQGRLTFAKPEQMWILKIYYVQCQRTVNSRSVFLLARFDWGIVKFIRFYDLFRA
jgi:hypothetical protein